MTKKEKTFLTEIIVAVRRCDLPMKRLVKIPPNISEDADYILNGQTGTLLIMSGVPKNLKKNGEVRT